jgi:[ribosomal protein S5]-alanine N-acetyltransferase
MIRVLETERLWLRPLELADAEQVQPLFARWEVVRFLNDKVPWPFPEDGVRTYYSEVELPAMVEALSHGAILRRPAGLSLSNAKEEIVRAVLAYLRG